ncbi:MAG: DUF2834 domain-containing protein [Mycobacterium sp.]
MTTSRRILCGVYAVIAVAALIATWTQNLAHMHTGKGFPGGFLQDLKANAATRSITVDLVLFFLAAAIFMVVEARRIGIPYVWAYIVGSMLTAVSVTFPLFLIARERKLAGSDPAALKTGDLIGLTVFTAVSAAGVIFASLA